MMNVIRLTLCIFLLAGWAAAHERYEVINTTDFVAHPDTYEGRLVEVRANVIAIGADSKSLQLFDGQTKMMIEVKLTQLSKAERRALVHNPVRHLSVYGQVSVIGGRLFIDAHKVEVLPLEANNSAAPAPGEVAR